MRAQEAAFVRQQQSARPDLAAADRASAQQRKLAMVAVNDEVRRILLEHAQVHPDQQPRYALPGVQPWIR